LFHKSIKVKPTHIEQSEYRNKKCKTNYVTNADNSSDKHVHYCLYITQKGTMKRIEFYDANFITDDIGDLNQKIERGSSSATL